MHFILRGPTRARDAKHLRLFNRYGTPPPPLRGLVGYDRDLVHVLPSRVAVRETSTSCCIAKTRRCVKPFMTTVRRFEV